MVLKATALPDAAEELKALVLDVDARNRARIESLKGLATAELLTSPRPNTRMV